MNENNQNDRRSVYLSGPITGLSRHEYLMRFALAESVLRNQGFRVINPTRLAPCRWPWLFRLIGYRLTLLYDLWHLWHCDYICLLPGYNQSKGSLIELSASYHMGVHVLSDNAQMLVNKAMIEYYKERSLTPDPSPKGEGSEKKKNAHILWLLVGLLMMALAFSSCTTTKVVPVDRWHTDTLRQTVYQRDSVMVHDSVMIKQKGDTCFVERWHTSYHDRWHHDTCFIHRVDSVPYPVEIIRKAEPSTTDKVRMWLGGAAFWLIVLGVLYLFIRRK